MEWSQMWKPCFTGFFGNKATLFVNGLSYDTQYNTPIKIQTQICNNCCQSPATFSVNNGNANQPVSLQVMPPYNSWPQTVRPLLHKPNLYICWMWLRQCFKVSSRSYNWCIDEHSKETDVSASMKENRLVGNWWIQNRDKDEDITCKGSAMVADLLVSEGLESMQAEITEIAAPALCHHLPAWHPESSPHPQFHDTDNQIKLQIARIRLQYLKWRSVPPFNSFSRHLNVWQGSHV